ncbi:MAG: tRNA (N6-threonylcarbamoyladenosine(37)-N6)-methyltransferase TrmO [Candidatus Latescibacteria bacterium]|nr:tRNA (N6-threonylcarbamoyladenosine(37)-N6)-methyltransferase TrmO [bacterium]MBD3424242.1 tRNA (N6-threonylcarbamoyladenosine(37)-N6)-methyltransferase TrmO [Candidatus Latescibacterota bacterium]
MNDRITYSPIGIIHSPFTEPAGTPIQPPGADGAGGEVEVFTDYAEGLEDLNKFSHIILLYHFHLAKTTPLRVKPFMDDHYHGVFAMRGPGRPNSIGLSVVSLERIDRNILHVRDLDIIDGTPLLDIKPYVPAFDARTKVKIGWLESNVDKLKGTRDDGRFTD